MGFGQSQRGVAHEVVVGLADSHPRVCGIGFKAGLGAVVDADEGPCSLSLSLLHAARESFTSVELHLDESNKVAIKASRF